MIKILFILLFGFNVYAQDAIELKNFGAENGLQSWTRQPGASVTIGSYTVPSVQNGKKYFVYNGGIGGNVFSQNIVLPTNYINQRCAFTFQYRVANPGASDYYAKVRNVTTAADLTAFQALPNPFPAAQDWTTRVVEFQCPSASDTIQIQFGDLNNTAAVFLHIDNVILSYKKVRTFYSGFITNNVASVIQSAAVMTAIESPNLTLTPTPDGVLVNQGNTNLGFAARIPCATGTASSGPNCGGVNETIGVSLILSAGTYDVCFKYIMQMGASDTAESDYQIARTEDATTTPIQIGLNLDYINDSTSNLRTQTQKLCQAFTVIQGGRTVFRLRSRRIGATGTAISQAGTIDITVQELY